MPFADEVGEVRVRIVSYQPAWAEEFEALRARLEDQMGTLAVAIDHIGSTSVPGLAAKDVLDVQVRVRRVDDPAIARGFAQMGFRSARNPGTTRKKASGCRVPSWCLPRRLAGGP